MFDPSGNWPEWLKSAVKWITKTVYNATVLAAQKALSKVEATYSRGLSVNGTPSIFNINFQAGISIDTKGNFAVQGSFNGGATTGTAGASITSYKSVTNAPSIYKLEGTEYQIGGSAGLPVYGAPVAVGGDFNIIPDNSLNKTYFGTTRSVGIGTPGVEFHVDWGETGTLNATRFNIFDVLNNAYIKIMEW